VEVLDQNEHGDRLMGHRDLLQLERVATVKTVTANYAMLVNDNFILADSTAGNITVTLPNSNTAKEVEVIKAAVANTVTVQTSGTDVIYTAGGATFVSLALKGTSVRLKAVTGGWWVLSTYMNDGSSTFGWRDLLGQIETRPSAGGGPSAVPDFVAYRGVIYQYMFGTNAPDNHLHEAFVNFHIPHDYVPGTDLFIHAHWSQNVVDTGGAAGVPGAARWYFDLSYADGNGTPGGAADPFPATINVSVTQQGSTTQYGHMIAEVQFTSNGGGVAAFDRNTIRPDGVILCRVYRIPAFGGDTLNQAAFLHFVDIHYQSTNVGTVNKVPNFYG